MDVTPKPSKQNIKALGKGKTKVCSGTYDGFLPHGLGRTLRDSQPWTLALSCSLVCLSRGSSNENENHNVPLLYVQPDGWNEITPRRGMGRLRHWSIVYQVPLAGTTVSQYAHTSVSISTAALGAVQLPVTVRACGLFIPESGQTHGHVWVVWHHGTLEPCWKEPGHADSHPVTDSHMT